MGELGYDVRKIRLAIRPPACFVLVRPHVYRTFYSSIVKLVGLTGMTKPNSSDRVMASQPDGGPSHPRENKARRLFRKLVPVVAIAASALAGSWFPQISAPLRSVFSHSTSGSRAPDEQAGQKAAEGLVKLTPEQISAAGIDTTPAGPGVLEQRIVAPALVTADPDRIGRVAAKVVGTVAELRKKLGDAVEKGEVIAVIDSREVADAKSEYLAAMVHYNLQSTLFQREKGLFEKKITAEQLFLRAQTAFTEAKLRVDLARQKLASLDLSESEIAALPQQPVGDLRRKEIRAPIAGRVIERRVNIGQPVGGEGQDKELYVLADLSVVWADVSVPVADLPLVREKQPVYLAILDGRNLEGRVVFVSPVLNQDTRSAKVVASFANHDFALRPGSLLTARVALAEIRVGVKVPRAAVQMVTGEPSVFVRTEDGFVKRKVETGAADDEFVEIVSGVAPGEQIATTNTFVLKADLGKGELESLD